MTDNSILWRRLDLPGHDSALLSFHKTFWTLSGTAVFAHDRRPCRLDYYVFCDGDWRTLSGRVGGWIGDKAFETTIAVDSAQRWRQNGIECPEVEGCIDWDLNFSPSTNLLPIRRLNLAVGEEATVRAAWLRFPEFTLEPLEQVYRRVDETTYRYESASGFAAELTVNEAGFVTGYPGFWRVEEGAIGVSIHHD